MSRVASGHAPDGLPALVGVALCAGTCGETLSEQEPGGYLLCQRMEGNRV